MSSVNGDVMKGRLHPHRPRHKHVSLSEERDRHRMKSFVNRVHHVMQQQRERIAKDKKKEKG